MKKFLLKSFYTLFFLGLLTSCTSEPMTDVEAQKWIAAFTPSRIDPDAIIRVEATDSLRKHIKKDCDLNDVFYFSSGIDGTAEISPGGYFIDFVPEKGALKEGKKYTCWVRLSELTDVDTLKDFSFDFYVEIRQMMFEDLHLSIDPDNAQNVKISGKLLFSFPPVQEELKSDMIECDGSALNTTFTPTDKDNCYTFVAKGIKRKNKDYTAKIGFSNVLGYKCDEMSVRVPGLADFVLMSAERRETAEPYIELEFSQPLSSEQSLDGLVSIDEIENVKIERNGAKVKVYYTANGLTSLTLRVSELVKARNGQQLSSDFEQTFEQEVIPPAVELPFTGHVLPDGNNLTLPFRAVNLAAVDVRVVKIYTSNVMRFLQTSDYDDDWYYSLNRYGKLIYSHTVRLDSDKKLNLHQWQNFSINLHGLFRKEPGAIYQIRITFRKEYSLYGREKPDDFKIIDGVTEAERDKWENCNYEANVIPTDTRPILYNWKESDDPTKDSYYLNSEHMIVRNIVASGIGVIAKTANAKRLWVTVTDIMSAMPLQGANVEVYNYQLCKIASATSDANGFADFSLAGIPFIVKVTKGSETSYCKVVGGRELSVSSFDVDGENVEDGIKGFVYGERGVWRPGDDIYLTLVVEDENHTLPDNYPVTMELYTPSRQLFDSKTLTKGTDGMYVFTAHTPEEAPTGAWKAEFKVGGRKFVHTVRIETIKPNRLKVNLKMPSVLEAGKPGNFTLNSKWLSGPAATGLQYRVNMALYPNPKPFDSYSQYTFCNPLKERVESEYELKTGFLDNAGNDQFSYTPPQQGEGMGIYAANITASVMEAGGEESISSQSVSFSPYPAYVGIDLKEGEFSTGTNVQFPVVTVNGAGKAVNAQVSYKVYRLSTNWWIEYDPKSLSRYVTEQSAELIASGSITTVGGKGDFSLKVEAEDRGRYLVYVSHCGGHATGGVITMERPEWRYDAQDDPTESVVILPFRLDKASYEVGEYATVYLPQAAGARVLLSIENGSKVISRRWVNTSANRETAHKILVTPEMAPNFYVFATMLQRHSQTVNDMPIRMYGVQGANVVNPRSVLCPVISVPDEVLPQQPFTVNIREKDGKPMTYTLAIVDEGLLDISSYKTPAIWKAMNRREYLGVNTYDMFDNVIGAVTGKFRSVLSIGGDEALRISAGKEKRYNPVVKFLGPFTLSGGSKSHKITLPMYVGSLRVMVVAAHSGSYGSSDKTVAVCAPLMVLPSLPAQLSCGDCLKLPVNVFVTEEGISDVTVSATVSGAASLSGAGSKTMKFSGKADKIAQFELKCGNSEGKAQIVVTATSGKQTATETIYVDVVNRNPVISSSNTIVLNSGKEHSLTLGSGISASVSSSPAIDYSAAFNYVDSYPHLCSEQLSSRLIFLLRCREFLSAQDKMRAEKLIEKLLPRLLSRQLPGGGFAYWDSGSEPHNWVTNMAGEVLYEAKRQGFSVNKTNIDNWVTYQTASARKYRHSTADCADLVQAYRLYTLSLSGVSLTAQMNKLRESKSLSRQAMLRLAAAYAIAGRKDVAAQIADKAAAMPEIAGNYYAFYSPIRDRAMELEDWFYVGNKVKALEIARDISAKFSVNAANTQEIAFVSSAMSLISEKGDGGCVTVTEKGKTPLTINGIKGVKTISATGSVTVKNTGNCNVYLTVSSVRKPRPEEKVKPVSKGVILSIDYVDNRGGIIDVSKLKQGQVFVARITVKNVVESSESMALTFAVPSGWEIWNERLNSDSSISNLDIRDDRISYYFPMNAGSSMTFKVRLRAAYAGNFVFPATVCEDMYNPACRALTSSKFIDVIPQ